MQHSSQENPSGVQVDARQRRVSRVESGLLLALLALLVGTPVWRVRAEEPSAAIGYQPMTSEGLAAGYPFEAWVLLDKSMDPTVAGYALPSGASIRVTFPVAFVPRAEIHPEVVLLYGWPQKAAPVRFSVALDPGDPRAIVITLGQALPAEPPAAPGLKVIHLRTGERNPTQPGDYPITLQFLNAGALSGTRRAIAHITAGPVPVIAAYNQLHDGRDEDWQHVKPGGMAPLPIDLLVTLPGEARASIALRSVQGGRLEILGDGRPIGGIGSHGVPVTLAPVLFGPGYSRLGIVRFLVTAGAVPGSAEIDAQLLGGPPYTLHVTVEE